MNPQLLIINQYDIEYLQYPIKYPLIDNVILVKGQLVTVVNEMLNKVTLLKCKCHLINLLWCQ